MVCIVICGKMVKKETLALLTMILLLPQVLLRGGKKMKGTKSNAGESQCLDFQQLHLRAVIPFCCYVCAASPLYVLTQSD